MANVKDYAILRIIECRDLVNVKTGHFRIISVKRRFVKDNILALILTRSLKAFIIVISFIIWRFVGPG